jgi:hypothetical protein
MKYVLLSGAIFFAGALSSLHAGYVVKISDGTEMSGKVGITNTAIEVGTDTSPTEINFSEILMAEFSDNPFQMNFFSSDKLKGTQMPANWKAGDIGTVDFSGSATVADGVFTLIGSGNFSTPGKNKRYADRCFFAGQQWQGDGQFTLRIKDIDQQTLNTAAGVMVRDTLDDNAAMCTLETTALGGGSFVYRDKTDGPARPTPISLTPPAWVRLTRFGNSIFASVSSDFQEWDWIGEADFASPSPWVGLYAHTKREKETGKATLDEITFTPSPSSAVVIPPGVVLQSGSFLAADCVHMQFDASDPDPVGQFNRSGSNISIPSSKISAITMQPLTRSQFADLGNHNGLLMKNGDTVDGSIDSVTNGAVTVNSVLLGITPYEKTAIRAAVLHPLAPQPAKYEIRLRDGSSIYATDVAGGKDGVAFTDLCGVKITANIDEIAQFRAGPALVQSLAETDFKATAAPAPDAKASAPAANVPAAGAAANAAPAIAPGAAPADAAPPLVGSWEGPDEEQVLEADAGTKMTFPLSGKFRAIAMRVMIGPESAPNAQATFRISADGNETVTPPIKAGDQPRFVQVMVQDPKSVTIIADSPYPGTKVLLIDAVAIRN